MSESSNKYDRLAMLILFMWPFVFLFRFNFGGLFPPEYFTLDVVHFYYPKVYLLKHLSEFKFPLWSPVEAGGFPFFSNPFNQACYPLNILLAIYYKLAGGFSWLDYQRFSTLGISMFAVFGYKWLRSLRVDLRPALFTMLVMAISYKVVGTMNRAPATHGLAWMTMILWGMTEVVLHGKRRKGGLLVVIATFMLFTNLYPYYIYYCIFLVPPYLLFLAFGGTRKAYTGIESIDLFASIKTLALSFATPLVLCLPFLINVRHTLATINTRSEASALYTKSGSFEFPDTLGALVCPPFSDMRGWYYFGLFALLIILLYIVNHFYCVSKRKPSKLILMTLFGYFLFITFLSYTNSLLFELFRNYFPGFGNFRAWGRLNVIMVFIFSLILSRAYNFLEEILLEPESRISDFKRKIFPFLGLFSLCYVVVLLTQVFLFSTMNYDHLWRLRILALFPEFQHYFYVYIGAIGFVVISLAVFLASRKTSSPFSLKTRRQMSFALIPILVFPIGLDVGYTSIYLRSHPNREFVSGPAHMERQDFDLQANLMTAFEAPKHSEYIKQIQMPVFFDKKTPMLSVRAGITFWMGSYTRFIEANSEVIPRREWRRLYKFKPDLKEFLGMNDGTKLYFSKRIDYPINSVADFLDDAYQHETSSDFQYFVYNYTGDVVDIAINAEKDGFFTLLDNYNKDWYVEVNEERAKIDKLFDTFKSVRVKKGLNYMHFRYDPPFFSILRRDGERVFPPRDAPLLVQKKHKKQKQSNAKKARIKNLKRLINERAATLSASKTVEWQPSVNLSITGQKIKSNIPVLWGGAGTVSSNRLGANLDGYLEFKINELQTTRFIGFSKQNVDNHFETIDYGIHITKEKQINLYHQGRRIREGIDVKVDDVLAIQRIQGHIVFRKNGVIVGLLEDETNSSLLIDLSFLSKGGSFESVRCSF